MNVNELTDAEVDRILERFDKTDPRLQRRIIVEAISLNRLVEHPTDDAEPATLAFAEELLAESVMSISLHDGAVNVVLFQNVKLRTKRDVRLLAELLGRKDT